VTRQVGQRSRRDEAENHAASADEYPFSIFLEGTTDRGMYSCAPDKVLEVLAFERGQRSRIGQEAVYPLTIVAARAIGVMRMRDEKGIDDKIVSVSVRDPSVAEYLDKAQLPSHVMRQVRRFFEDYKVLEQKHVVVEDLLGPSEAVAIIAEALEMYRRLRRGEIK
jgi:hypothetical protein